LMTRFILLSCLIALSRLVSEAIFLLQCCVSL
jgi:hypothetical protein